jgi:hypothetical protein
MRKQKQKCEMQWIPDIRYTVGAGLIVSYIRLYLKLGVDLKKFYSFFGQFNMLGLFIITDCLFMLGVHGIKILPQRFASKKCKNLLRSNS